MFPRRSILHAVCSALLMLFFSGPLSAQRYTFRQYGSAQGLSNMALESLVEDHTGYIWAGTDNGLFRYDGNGFRGFHHEEGLPNTEIQALAESPQGVLWIGTPSGLSRREGMRFVVVDIGVQGPVTKIAFDHAGQIYLQHSDGIFRGTPEGPDSYRFQKLIEAPANALFVKDENIWFSKDGDLWKLDGDRPVRVGTPHGLPSDSWNSIVEDSLGNLWACSHTRLYSLPAGGARFVNHSTEIPHAAESHLYADRHGRIYASSDSGVVILEGSHHIVIDSDHGLPMDAVGPVLVDREETLWMGLYGGGLVRRLGHGEWISWRKEDGLPHSTIWAIQGDRYGRTWIGTGQGLSIIGKDDKVERNWTVHNGLPGERVLSIIKGGANDFYVGTQPFGIVHFDQNGKLLETYDRSSGVTLDWVNSMAIDRDHHLWVAGSMNCIRSKDPVDGQSKLIFEAVTPPDVPTSLRIRNVFADNRGTIWLGTSQGALHFDGSKWTLYNSKDGLRSGVVSIIRQAGDSYWIAYRDALGLTRLRFDKSQTQATTFGSHNGLSSDQIQAIAMDATGRIWATNDNGVDILENGQWHHFDMDDGLIWNDSDGIALYVDGENRVWIGTSNGLSRYAPLSYVVPDEPPTVVLTSIRGESREWQNNEQAILPYAHRSLTVRFASLKYAFESRTRFLYRLRGYDKSWKQATEQSVNFTALPAGNYVFEVIAVTPNGQSSLMPASFRFTIKSPWWQSWWFLTSCLLLVGLLLHFLWRVRVSMLLTQTAQLENIVAERTAELSESHRLLEQIAYIDSLTSLPNRRMFTESFRNRLALAQKKSECVVLLLVDLDRFKEINDHLGHDAGDAVLIEAASRLRKAVRESDCVARVGGDEFGIILLTPHRLEDVQALCERILESFVEGILFKDKVLKTTPSIGVAIFPEHGDSQESLYKSADLALYEAKRMGRNGFCWYNPELFTEN